MLITLLTVWGKVYDILVQLTSLAMQRVLKSTALEQSPGGEISIDINESEIDAVSEKDLSTTKMASLPASEIRKFMQPLKLDLAAQKRDKRFRTKFRLPATERLILTVNAVHIVEEGDDKKVSTYHGNLFLSEAFLTFSSSDKGQFYDLVMPLYTIRRVERLNEKTPTFSIKIVNWHQNQSLFRLEA